MCKDKDTFLAAHERLRGVAAAAASAPHWSLPLADVRKDLRHGKLGEWQRPGNRMVHT
jgi:hypothetical protein